jgi:hypothetical protein
MTDYDIINLLDLPDYYSWLYGSYIIGRYKVSTICIDSETCKHNVTDIKTDKTYILTRTQLYILCILYWVDIPHFYPEWRRKC